MEIPIVLDMEDFMILFSTVLFGILMGGLLVGEDLIRSTLLSAIMADFIIPMGFGFGYGNRWGNRFNRWNRFGDYYGNDFNRRNNRDYRSTVARIKSGRGEKTYNSDSSRSRRNSRTANSKANEIQTTLNRLNVGRGTRTVGRSTLVGFDRNRLGITSAGSSRPVKKCSPLWAMWFQEAEAWGKLREIQTSPKAVRE